METKEKMDEIYKKVVHKVFSKLCGDNSVSFLESEAEERCTIILNHKEKGHEIYLQANTVAAQFWSRFVGSVFCPQKLLTIFCGADKSEEVIERLFQQVYLLTISEFKKYMKDKLFLDVEDITAISALYYEGNPINGNIYLFFNDTVELLVEFFDDKNNKKIRIHRDDYRTIRKNIEMTYADNVGASEERIGLAFCYNGEWCLKGLTNQRANAISIRFLGHTIWEIYWDNEPIVKYNCGIYEHASSKEEKSREFICKHTSLYSNSNDELKRMEECVQAAMNQKHGTILVVIYDEMERKENNKMQNDAQKEADRLVKESSGILIKNSDNNLNREVLGRLMSIDGALLVDCKGVPWGYGLILDSTPEGNEIDLDPGRGSRFHSAKRYINSKKCAGKKALALIVSEDGMVNSFSTEDVLKEKCNE